MKESTKFVLYELTYLLSLLALAPLCAVVVAYLVYGV